MSRSDHFDKTISFDVMKQITLDHRSHLVNAYRFRCTQSAAHCAMDLTLHAIERGFVGDRKLIKGNTMEEWCRKGSATLWAIYAACELLFDMDYVPDSFDEYVTFIFIYLDSHALMVDSVDAAMAVFPASFDRDIVHFVVDKYFSA